MFAERSATRHRSGALGSAVALALALLFCFTPAPANAASAPGKPAAPVANFVSGGVQVTWTAPTGAPTDYAVRYSNDNGTTWSEDTDTGSSNLSYTYPNLPRGHSYMFSVRGSNSQGWGPYSDNSSQFSIPPSVPDAPTGVVGTPGDGQATVNWTAPYDGGAAIDHYTVNTYRYQDANGFVGATQSAGTTATVSGLTNDTQYVFIVIAHNSVGASSLSQQSDPVMPLQAPSVPTAVTAERWGPATLNVSWTEAETGTIAQNFQEIHSTDDGHTWSAPTTLHYSHGESITGLTIGTAYRFKIRAQSGGVYSDWSAPSSPVSPAAAPGAPTGVRGIAGDGQVTLSWTAPSNDGGDPVGAYEIQYSADGTPWSTPPIVSLTPATTYTVTGLTNGTSYRFQVLAANKVQPGPWSLSSAPITPTAVPPAPVGKTIYGTAKKDVIQGTEGDDVIYAKGGNDVVYGNGGNDTIIGGAGNDKLFGGDGTDTLKGGSGRDKCDGGTSNDTAAKTCERKIAIP